MKKTYTPTHTYVCIIKSESEFRLWKDHGYSWREGINGYTVIP